MALEEQRSIVGAGAQVQESEAISGLDFLWLELTGKCNLRCVHCYANSSPEMPLHDGMGLPDWQRVLQEAYAPGCRKVQFIGGEVTLYPHLPDLIERARLIGFTHVEVFTNGIAVTESLRSTFIRFNVKLAFSVYSMESEIHDAVTLRKGSLTRTLDSLRWALASGLSIRVALIDVGDNPAGVENTTRELHRLGIDAVQVDRVRGVGRGASIRSPESVMEELCGKCWQGKLCITASGQMFPCVFSRSFPVGDIDDRIASVLNGAALVRFREDARSLFGGRIGTCNPQCGPDCGPATCGPQSCKPTGN